MTTPLLTLLFLLFAFTTKLNVTIASVLDTDGKWVRNGGNYYILPSFEEMGGGVTLASVGVRHPLAVVQFASKNSLGLPVSISAEGTSIIQTDEMVTVKFPNIPDSTWMLVKDESANVWYIGIGSANDYPGNQIMTGSLQIKEYDLGYKFVFYSDVNTSYCGDVGIYNDADENNRLALYGSAFAVEFKNADESSFSI